MLIVRCTTRLLKGLGVPDAPESKSPDSALGEWYATSLQLRPRPVVLLVNEPTRLAVVLPLRDFAAPGEKIAAAIAHVVADLGVGADVMERERRAMSDVAFARAGNRGITAATNELTLHLEQFREMRTRASEHEASLHLGKVVIAIPGHGHQRPADVATQLLARTAG
jgi:hypothetical protein